MRDEPIERLHRRLSNGQTGQFVNVIYQLEENRRILFYPSPSKFFKIARTIFGDIQISQDFAAPPLENDTFDLQTGWSGWSSR